MTVLTNTQISSQIIKALDGMDVPSWPSILADRNLSELLVDDGRRLDFFATWQISRFLIWRHGELFASLKQRRFLIDAAKVKE